MWLLMMHLLLMLLLLSWSERLRMWLEVLLVRTRACEWLVSARSLRVHGHASVRAHRRARQARRHQRRVWLLMLLKVLLVMLMMRRRNWPVMRMLLMVKVRVLCVLGMHLHATLLHHWAARRLSPGRILQVLVMHRVVLMVTVMVAR